MFTPKLYKLYKLPLTYIVDSNYRCRISDEDKFKYIISQQDNQLFRQIRIVTNDNDDFNKWIVFVNCNGLSEKESAVERLVKDGFYINDVHFVLSERSASMTRNSILSFVESSISEEIDTRVTMGIKINTTVLSKYYAYRGLVLSSCHCIENWYPKIIIVPDGTRVLKDQVIKGLYDKQTEYEDENGVKHPFVQKDVAEIHKDIELNMFDGCGICHPAITEYVQNYLNIKEQPTTLLIRAPYIKGVVHQMDYTGFYEQCGICEITDIWGIKHGVTADSEPMMILSESMYKGFKYFKLHGDCSDWAEYWRNFKKYNHCIGITKWNFTKEREPIYTRANYQILQDLSLDYDDFESLAVDSVEWAEKIMHGDLLHTYCFLGMTADCDTVLNSYCKAILKNPNMINEPSVKKYIRQSLSKYRDEFKCGKIWIKGCFKFLAPDLIAFMEHVAGLEPIGCLAKGEFYSHDIDGNMHGDYSIERNPHICASEHVILNAVENDKTIWVEHLDNVAMINLYDITPARLQGADHDGDLVLVIDNKTYQSGVNRNGIPVIDIDDKITVQAEEDTFENRSKVIVRSMKSLIGEYSNYSSAYHNKKPRSDESRQKYNKFIDIISVATGKSID